MPAVAVPAAVSLVGMAANAIGQHKQMSAQQKADLAKQQRIQGVMDANRADELAWQQANSGTLSSMLAGAMGPQTTSSSGSQWSDTTSDTLQEMDFGPEGNAAAADVLLAAKNAPFEVQNLLAGMKAGAERDLAAAGRAQNTAIANRAAKMGVDPGLMRIGADQGLNAQRLANNQGIAQQGYEMKRQAYGDITGVLKSLFQKNKTHQTSQMKGGSRSTSTGPAAYGAAAGILELLKPPKREVAV